MDNRQSASRQLSKVLNVMFPPAYIQLYHQPPNSVCSLLNIRRWWPTKTTENSKQTPYHYEASTEPSSRASLIALREQLSASLIEHQAKMVGLCPVRRAIFDQCFDELIRQVTVGCIEQGLLLFRIRNELRMTINCYRKIYQAGVEFGLNKAIKAELEMDNSCAQIRFLEESLENIEINHRLKDRKDELEMRNKLERVDKLEEYYRSEMTKKDQVIEQQRAIIRALSRKSASDIKGPILS